MAAPIVTAADAIAALDFIEGERDGLEIEPALFDALRAYISLGALTSPLTSNRCLERLGKCHQLGSYD